MSQGKGAEPIDNILYTRDCREDPFELLLVDTLWEERDHPEDPASIATKRGERRGAKRQVNRGGETIGGIALAVLIR